MRGEFSKLITDYVLRCEKLHFLFVLVDIRLEPQKIDLRFIEMLGTNGVPFGIVFTKADKLGPVKARMNAEKWMHALEDRWVELLLTSSPAVRRSWVARRARLHRPNQQEFGGG